MDLTKKEKVLVMKYENELDELSMLVEQEYSTELTEKDSNRYMKLVTLLHGYGVPIELGIEI